MADLWTCVERTSESVRRQGRASRLSKVMGALTHKVAAMKLKNMTVSPKTRSTGVDQRAAISSPR